LDCIWENDNSDNDDDGDDDDGNDNDDDSDDDDGYDNDDDWDWDDCDSAFVCISTNGYDTITTISIGQLIHFGMSGIVIHL